MTRQVYPWRIARACFGVPSVVRFDAQMNTKLLMAASASVLAVAGIAGSFLPHELLTRLGVEPDGLLPTIVQLHAALLLGFAAVNWMAKDSLIGGIYNRPVALGNLLHFTVGAITLVKFVIGGGAAPLFVIIATVLYVLFATGFAIVLFGSPVKPA